MLYAVAVESPVDLAAGAVIAQFQPANGASAGLRRLIVGGRGASSPGQVTVAVTTLGIAGVPDSTVSATGIGVAQWLGHRGASIGEVSTTFTTDPTNYSGPGSPPLYELSFNSEGGSEKLKWGFGEFVIQSPPGDDPGPGLLLYTVNAVPSGFLYTVTFEVDDLR